jgi:SulP family sulfate permease
LRASVRWSISSRTPWSSLYRRRGTPHIAAQLKNFFGVPVPAGLGFFETLGAFVQRAGQIDPGITITAVATLAVAMVGKRFLRRIPYMIVAMIAGSLVGYALVNSNMFHVPTVGSIAIGRPIALLPSFDLETWRRIFPPPWRSPFWASPRRSRSPAPWR